MTHYRFSISIKKSLLIGGIDFLSPILHV